MEQITIRIPSDELEEFDKYIESDVVFENRSHAIRVAMRQFTNKEEREVRGIE